jgi:hypothetical protein
MLPGLAAQRSASVLGNDCHGSAVQRPLWQLPGLAPEPRHARVAGSGAGMSVLSLAVALYVVVRVEVEAVVGSSAMLVARDQSAGLKHLGTSLGTRQQSGLAMLGPVSHDAGTVTRAKARVQARSAHTAVAADVVVVAVADAGGKPPEVAPGGGDKATQWAMGGGAAAAAERQHVGSEVAAGARARGRVSRQFAWRWIPNAPPL